MNNKTTSSTENNITDFRKKNQPNSDERILLKYRLYKFSNMAKLSRLKLFNVHPQQVQQAFNGLQPTLMNKIVRYIEHREQKTNSKNLIQ